MSIFKTFAGDDRITKVIAEPNKDKTIPRVTLRRMMASNIEWQKHVEGFSKTFKMELQLDILTEEQSKGPILDAFVDCILVGWENIQREDGTVIEYSKEAAKALMLELPDLYTTLRQMATSLSTFRPSEDEAKN